MIADAAASFVPLLLVLFLFVASCSWSVAASADGSGGGGGNGTRTALFRVLINHASLGTPRGRFEEHNSKFSLS